MLCRADISSALELELPATAVMNVAVAGQESNMSAIVNDYAQQAIDALGDGATISDCFLKAVDLVYNSFQYFKA